MDMIRKNSVMLFIRCLVCFICFLVLVPGRNAVARRGRMRMQFFAKIDTMQRAANYFKKGRKLFAEGNFNSALTAFDDARKVQPDLADAYFWMGKTYTELGKTRKAHKAFNRYLKYISTSANPESSLLYLNENGVIDNAQAIEYENELASLRQDTSYWLKKGKIEVKTGVLKQAVESFNNGLKLSPENFPLLQQLGRALTEQGKHLQAIKIFQKIISSPDIEARDYGAYGDCLRSIKEVSGSR